MMSHSGDFLKISFSFYIIAWFCFLTSIIETFIEVYIGSIIFLIFGFFNYHISFMAFCMCKSEVHDKNKYNKKPNIDINKMFETILKFHFE